LQSGRKRLLKLITSPQPGKRPRMPKDGKSLTAGQVAILRRWIETGAVWPEDLVIRPRAKTDRSWWSFRPLTAVTPPAVSDAPAAWQQNPIDRFFWAKLREKTLTPSPPAEPRSLIRRLCYDLTG